MNHLQIFLPCAAGVEELLRSEVAAVTQRLAADVRQQRGGVSLEAAWRDVQLLNLHSRLAQRSEEHTSELQSPC